MALIVAQELLFVSFVVAGFLWGKYLVKIILESNKWNNLAQKFFGFLVLIVLVAFLPQILANFLVGILSESTSIIISLIILALAFLEFSMEYD